MLTSSMGRVGASCTGSLKYTGLLLRDLGEWVLSAVLKRASVGGKDGEGEGGPSREDTGVGLS